MPASTIQARAISHSYRKDNRAIRAVSDLDLDIGQGQIAALLGPNGAGKSTVFRILTTLLRPQAGSARIAGHDVALEPLSVRKNIGSVGQGSGLGRKQTLFDELVLQGRSQGLPRSEARRNAEELIGRLELAGLEDRRGSELSGGQRRRADIALGLIHKPLILFLDEPTTGLDPHSRANLWSHVRELRQTFGMTVLFTTHYLDEADTAAERILIMDGGAVVADDTPSKLKATLGGDRLSISVKDPQDAADVVAIGERIAGVNGTFRNGSEIIFTVASGVRALPHVITLLADSGVQILDASLTTPTLDDVFLHITGRPLDSTTN